MFHGTKGKCVHNMDIICRFEKDGNDGDNYGKISVSVQNPDLLSGGTGSSTNTETGGPD
jgi:hypothetical protein